MTKGTILDTLYIAYNIVHNSLRTLGCRSEVSEGGSSDGGSSGEEVTSEDERDEQWEEAVTGFCRQVVESCTVGGVKQGGMYNFVHSVQYCAPRTILHILTCVHYQMRQCCASSSTSFSVS
jgi:hypothetical protein